LSFHTLSGQTPDYDLNEWIDNNFDRKVNYFFKAVTLQTSHSYVAAMSADERLAVGGATVMASSWNQSELSPITGKAGVLPTLEADLLVTSNLYLNGLYSGFSSYGDVTILTRYGFTLLFDKREPTSSRWMVNFFRGQLSGSKDFFLKTVGVEIIRQINYTMGYWWIGAGSGFYDAGIHIKNPNKQLVLKNRVKGQTNFLCWGLSREFSGKFAVEIEMKLHPSCLSVMVGGYRSIR